MNYNDNNCCIHGMDYGLMCHQCYMVSEQAKIRELALSYAKIKELEEQVERYENTLVSIWTTEVMEKDNLLDILIAIQEKVRIAIDGKNSDKR